MTTARAKTLARVLPERAALLLQRAALTEIPHADPHARLRAIEKAITQVQREFPEHFRKEQ